MGHDAHHQQRAEPVAGVEGDPEAPQDQQGEDQHDDAGADKPQLLANHGEDEVVVLLRQVQEFLAAAAEAHAQQTAGANGDQALGQLIAVAGVVQPRVMPHGDAGRAVLDDTLFRQLDKQEAQGGHAAHAGSHQPALYAAHDHQHRTGTQDQHRAGQVGLQHHQHGDDAQQRHIGQDALAPRQHFLLFLGDGVGEVDDDRQLGDLRRLELEHALDAQPPGGVVGGDGQRVMGDDDQDQQEQRQSHQDPGGAAPALVVDLGHHEHGRQTHCGKQRLPLEIIGAVPGVVVGAGEAGGEQHDQAHHRQKHRQDQEGQVHGALGGLLVLLLRLAHPLLGGLLRPIFLPGHGCPSFPIFCKSDNALMKYIMNEKTLQHAFHHVCDPVFSQKLKRWYTAK